MIRFYFPWSNGQHWVLNTKEAPEVILSPYVFQPHESVWEVILIHQVWNLTLGFELNSWIQSHYMHHVSFQVLLCLQCYEHKKLWVWLSRISSICYFFFLIHEACPVCCGEHASILSFIFFIWHKTPIPISRDTSLIKTMLHQPSISWTSLPHFSLFQ